jgi:hypothetical protein
MSLDEAFYTASAPFKLILVQKVGTITKGDLGTEVKPRRVR